jgi:death-on-curing protein
LLNEPRWLPVEAIIEHNRIEVEVTGERHVLRDRGLLESALARPRNFFGFGEEDSVVLAVVLKRTAFAAMRLFLLANGYDTAFDDKVSWAEEVIALVEHRSTEEEFVRTIRPFVVAR